MSDSFTNITAYKGFDHNLQCRGFQFELQQTYGAIVHIRAAVAGQDVKSDTWYALNAAVNLSR